MCKTMGAISGTGTAYPFGADEFNPSGNMCNTIGATSGAGTAYPSGAPEFTSCFSEVRVA